MHLNFYIYIINNNSTTIYILYLKYMYLTYMSCKNNTILKYNNSYKTFNDSSIIIYFVYSFPPLEKFRVYSVAIDI